MEGGMSGQGELENNILRKKSPVLTACTEH